MQRHQFPIDEALLPSSAITRDGGYAAIGALLAADDPATAALCFNDVVAFGVMLGLQSHGLLAGQDFSVIGFDDIAEADLWRPPLTTISIAPHQMGTLAAQRLVERIARPGEAPTQTILPPHLVIRESCGTHPV